MRAKKEVFLFREGTGFFYLQCRLVDEAATALVVLQDHKPMVI